MLIDKRNRTLIFYSIAVFFSFLFSRFMFRSTFQLWDNNLDYKMMIIVMTFVGLIPVSIYYYNCFRFIRRFKTALIYECVMIFYIVIGFIGNIAGLFFQNGTFQGLISNVLSIPAVILIILAIFVLVSKEMNKKLRVTYFVSAILVFLSSGFVFGRLIDFILSSNSNSMGDFSYIFGIVNTVSMVFYLVRTLLILYLIYQFYALDIDEDTGKLNKYEVDENGVWEV